ncbi:sulfotransferase family protein [Dyella terrae]|jgi:sulfotransferase|uniref:sulfotransferase family protein n=1 Tax=Dyella terrae TaxID=522259 RepID=UPI0018EB36F3|nr:MULTISPECIES: sulfotransferase [Dyella]ULU24215.1 sulfotransferase [Dyella terrae]
MFQRIHFISGLPRAGSTLLAALLRQNPRFHADMSGPLAGLFTSMLGEMSGRNEFSVFIDDAKRQRLLRGLFDNFYADQPASVIFDTSRAWCARLPALATLFPDSRVIACVRQVPWILDSVERLVQKNAFLPSSIFNYSAGGTVYSRVNGIAGSDGMLGYAYDALKEAFYGEHAKRLLLVQYETLVSNPAMALAAIYDFIGEPAFTHNTEHVDFDASEFDAKAGTPGLHAVRPRVEARERPTLLPPDLFRRFENDAFWRDPNLNPHGVRIV